MRRYLSNKEKKALAKRVAEFGYELDKKRPVEIVDDKFVMVNKTIIFFYNEGALFPTLKWLQNNPNILPSVTVDKGAISFVVNGADIMRPGITKIDDIIKKGSIVTVKEEVHGKGIALGQAMYDADEMRGMDSGKVIRNLHYVGDSIWYAE